jgi:hypothetical protein
MSASFVEPRVVVHRGLRFLKIDPKGKWSKERRHAKFKKHFGGYALTIASQWYDLCHTDIKKAKLTTKEISRGFKMFLIAHHYLWNYPRNSDQVADTFDVCEAYSRGSHLWIWIGRIAALEKKVIFWPKALDRDNTEVLAISVDGTDKKDWERKHQTEKLPYDRKNFSKKHQHGALKYQVTLAAQRQQCIHIYGPVRGGMSDKEMLARSGVLRRLRKGKLCSGDRGYIDKKWKHQVSWPNLHDSKETNNMKSRIRLRHETFNGKMSQYGTMRQNWRHTKEQHGLAFRAVAVTIQYALDNGNAFLFEA